ncbi:hypothetical protein HDV05_002764, partial [Chytridiales sp. JEL 0842]
LDKDFKEFLRKASMFGQYFQISDINRVFGDHYDTGTQFLAWKKDVDSYNFLARNDEESEDANDWFFRHITVSAAIYDTLSFEQRTQWHLQIARYLESSNESNLESIAFHYSRTPEVLKNVHYLEKLG